jgi:hypothetical protein
VDNQRSFFDNLATKLNIQKPEDWGKVTGSVVMKERGGYFISNYYSGSLYKGIEMFILQL